MFENLEERLSPCLNRWIVTKCCFWLIQCCRDHPYRSDKGHQSLHLANRILSYLTSVGIYWNSSSFPVHRHPSSLNRLTSWSMSLFCNNRGSKIRIKGSKSWIVRKLKLELQEKKNLRAPNIHSLYSYWVSAFLVYLKGGQKAEEPEQSLLQNVLTVRELR